MVNVYQNVSENCIAIPYPRYSTVRFIAACCQPARWLSCSTLTTGSQDSTYAFPSILPKRLLFTAKTVATDRISTEYTFLKSNNPTNSRKGTAKYAYRRCDTLCSTTELHFCTKHPYGMLRSCTDDTGQLNSPTFQRPAVTKKSVNDYSLH
jgi:hypothetical protein